jgi:hypothetical protein
LDIEPDISDDTAMRHSSISGTDLVTFGDQLERYVIDSQTGVTAPSQSLTA